VRTKTRSSDLLATKDIGEVGMLEKPLDVFLRLELEKEVADALIELQQPGGREVTERHLLGKAQLRWRKGASRQQECRP
jgi:hypothetical protein